VQRKDVMTLSAAFERGRIVQKLAEKPPRMGPFVIELFRKRLGNRWTNTIVS
jgi:hypothetical protein